MKTDKYLQELEELNGHLNPFPMKTNDKSPDYGGYLKINNKVYRISAWVKKNKEGKKILSLKAMKCNFDGSINLL
jgi:hypothetical protein